MTNARKCDILNKRSKENESLKEKTLKKVKKVKKVLDKLKKICYNKEVVARVTKRNGSIAQLGEHLPYKQRVTGSIPVVSTKTWPCSSVG